MKSTILLLAGLLFCGSLAYGQEVMKAPSFSLGLLGYKKELKAGTPLFLELPGRVYSEEASIGQLVRLRLRNDVTVEGRVVLAAGAAATGRVVEVLEATYSEPASVTLEALEVHGVNGQLVPLTGRTVLWGRFPNESMVVPAASTLRAWVLNDSEIKWE